MGVVFLVNQSGLLPQTVAFPQIISGVLDALTGIEPSGGMAVSTIYWIIIVVALASIYFDVRWWRVHCPSWRQQSAERPFRQVWPQIGREFIWPAVLFFGVPALLTMLGNRGTSWQQMFTHVPDLSLLLWYGILMGVAKGVAKASILLRRPAAVPHQMEAVSQ